MYAERQKQILAAITQGLGPPEHAADAVLSGKQIL